MRVADYCDSCDDKSNTLHTVKSDQVKRKKNPLVVPIYCANAEIMTSGRKTPKLLLRVYFLVDFK